MFGFDSTPRSVSLDWSYFGGAEELPPWLRRVAKATAPEPELSSESSKSFRVRHRNSYSSSEGETDGFGSSESSTSNSDQDLVDELLTSDTSYEDLHVPQNTSIKTSDGSPWLPKVLKDQHDGQDFLWLLTEEPHRSRRQAILKSHPEIKTLMGREPLTKWIALGVVALQIFTACAVTKMGWHPFSWKFLLTAYIIGGTANQNIFLAIHEITHNLAFKGIKANKILAITANSVIGIPYAMMFKQYHIEHHKHLGEDGVDTDLPTRLELMCLKNVLGKAFFATFQIFFYALRPGFIKTQRLTIWHILNFAFQFAFDLLLIKTMSSWKPFIYLIFSSFFAGSLHPCAAHFIAEHYLFGGLLQETWSYYGPLNILAYNVGYHNEHHDFPSVPWTRLPEIKRMAPEFYDCLPHHTSWPMVTVQFILGTDSGLWARIKRKARGTVAAGYSRQQDQGDVQGHELQEEVERAKTS
ncbi:unnamed protein product [Sympodiomycopsis kandeliae]